MDNISRYDPVAIGFRIGEERKAIGWSMEAVATHIGTTRQSISKWENGQGEPTVYDLLRLCNLFDCDLGYLLCEEGYSCKTRKATDIKAATGLSEYSIISLADIAGDQKFGATTLRFLNDLLDYSELPYIAIAYEQLKDGAHKGQEYNIMDDNGKFVDFLCGDVDLLILQNRFTRFALNSSEVLSLKASRREWAMKTDKEKEELLAMFEEDLQRGK